MSDTFTDSSLSDDAGPAKPAGFARAKTGEMDELLLAGTVIDGRYRIESLLGEGGMGAVYSAEHVKVGRRVAFKVLSAQWTSVGVVARRFRDEARAASAAGHPNIIEVFDAGELPDGRPYLVMELLEGRELTSVIASQGFLEPKRACQIVRDVARALDAAHARGIIHRDLKGENVMLVGRGGEETVKVLDFGIAANSSALGPRATTPGLIIGTPAYMAPEQARAAAPTIAFDIYALGVLLHEALTGQLPFEHLDGLALLAAKTSERAPSVATLRDGLPPTLVELVDSCLALDPSMRPANAREVADRLREIIELPELESPRKKPTLIVPPRGGTEPSGAGPTTPAEDEPRWRTVALVAALVALVGLGVGWWVLGRDEPEPVAASGTPPLAPTFPERRDDARVQADLPPPIEPIPTPAEDPPPSEPAEPSDAKREPTGDSPSRAQPGKNPPSEPTPATVADAGRPSEPAPANDPDSGLCWRTRKQAQQAREGHDWTGVLRHTRNAGCWSEERDTRKKLRTKAFMELGHWSECAEAGRGLDDPEGRRWQELCRRRKEQG